MTIEKMNQLQRLFVCGWLFASFFLVGFFGETNWSLRITAIVGMGTTIGIWLIMRQDVQTAAIKDAHLHSKQRQIESMQEQIKAQDEMIELYRTQLGRDL